MKPMAMPEKITNDRPKSGLRENVGSISDTMPHGREDQDVDLWVPE